MQPHSIPCRALLIACALALGIDAIPARQIEPERSASGTARDGASPAPGAWTEVPGYVDLFAPAQHQSTYRAYVSPYDLDTALRMLAGEPSLLHPPGAWEPRRIGALEAFGHSGPYNRWTLSRLYAGTPVSMAVGPRAEDGRVTETWTLLAPYPDPALMRLEPGTLLLVARLTPEA